MKSELFNAEETPFNLAGETLDNGLTEEGEARVRALAAREARKAQRSLDFNPKRQTIEDRLTEIIGRERAQAECRGMFD